MPVMMTGLLLTSYDERTNFMPVMMRVPAVMMRVPAVMMRGPNVCQL